MMKRYWRLLCADAPVPLWFALVVNIAFMILAFLLGVLLAPCIDAIGF